MAFCWKEWSEEMYKAWIWDHSILPKVLERCDTLFKMTKETNNVFVSGTLQEVQMKGGTMDVTMSTSQMLDDI